TEPNPPPAISPRAISEPYEKYQKQVLDTEQQIDGTMHAQINMLRSRMKNTPDSLPADVKQALQGFREGTLPDQAQRAKIEPQFEAGVPEKLKTLRETLVE